ncbi:MAG: hypothetical protein QOI40_2794 [Alphaproteobacteria bacterium]|nr:hypothetical protein [Alphaproteobacteria bacterium]
MAMGYHAIDRAGEYAAMPAGQADGNGAHLNADRDPPDSASTAGHTSACLRYTNGFRLEGAPDLPCRCYQKEAS